MNLELLSIFAMVKSIIVHCSKAERPSSLVFMHNISFTCTNARKTRYLSTMTKKYIKYSGNASRDSSHVIRCLGKILSDNCSILTSIDVTENLPLYLIF